MILSSAIERFNAAYLPVPESGCWLWEHATNGLYGVMRYNGRQEYAHRVAFALFRGPIPQGIIVCHKCDVPSCVNPEHLFLGTHKTNCDDKFAKGRANYIRRTQCIRGHTFDSDNVYVDALGNRSCKECNRTRAREWHRKQARKV